MSVEQEETPAIRALSADSLDEALEQLRLRLLDLTGRNRLLNFKHTPGRSLPFVEGSLAGAYERLVEGANRPTIAIQGLPEPPRRAWIDRNGRLARPDPREWAQQNDIRTSYDLLEGAGTAAVNVRALLYHDDLARHCRKLEREANLAIEETGSNMLFLVLGFLDYPDQRDSDRIFSAPLLSVPVSLSRKDASGKQNFYIQYTGEDITDNVSLREKLRQDFSIVIPSLFEEDISGDDTVDISAYLGRVRKIIKDQPRFTVRDRLSLALLSFTNMLLVRDLDAKNWPKTGEANGLIDHPIIQKVFGSQTDGESFGEAAEHPVEDGVGAKVQLVFDADSSQHRALVDAIFEKKNLVIEGPPGTGKSQTIGNLIANSIAEGKRTLFIAEKLEALNVVKTRLSAAGLDPFILELHSNKTSKKKVLEEIQARLDCRTIEPSDLSEKLEKLEDFRRELKEYANTINSVLFNRLGLTVHELAWRAERNRALITVGHASLFSVEVSVASEISAIELARRVDALEYLGAQFQEIGGFDHQAPFWGFEPEAIDPGDEARLADLFSSAAESANALASDAARYEALIGEKVVDLGLKRARDQLSTLRNLDGERNDDLDLQLLSSLLASDGTGATSRRVLNSLSRHIARYRDLAPIAAAGVKSESEATSERLGALRDLGREATSVGASLGSTIEVADLLAKLRAAIDTLEGAIESIGAFCSQRRITFTGATDELQRLARLSRLVAEAPEAALRVQCSELAREGAAIEVARIKDVQDQWRATRESLSEILYLDVSPPKQALDAAVLALRQGDAWHRIFDGKWRAGINLHKGLLRSRQKMAAKDRLRQLEELREWKDLRAQLNADGAWLAYLGCAAPPDFVPLDDHLVVAQWNREMVGALEDAGAQDISVGELTPEKARALRREFAGFGAATSVADKSLNDLLGALPALTGPHIGGVFSDVLDSAKRFAEAISGQLLWLETQCPAQRTFNECLVGCEAALERSQIAGELNSGDEFSALFGAKFRGVDTDIEKLAAVLAFGDKVIESELPQALKRLITTSDPVKALEQLELNLSELIEGLERVEALEVELSNYGKFDLEGWAGLGPQSNLQDFGSRLAAKLELAAESVERLAPWAAYIARRSEVDALGLGAFRARLENGDATPRELGGVYAYCVYAAVIRNILRKVPGLGKFAGLKHSQIRDQFKRLDRETIKLRGKAIAGRARSRARLVQGQNGPRVDDKTEVVLLNYLLPQQRPRMPVRKIMARAGRSIQALKPCFMMSPQAVAQFLQPGKIKFDLVIMDEASQLKPEQAIGAIARGAQLVVVGDPKQLPPTSFFTRGGQSGDEDEEYATDAESILEVCSAQFQPSRFLRWHYRSQHHSLIAFSNANYYKNLIIFPSPYGQSATLGVRATYLADAIYDNQTNLKEARRVVDAVVEHIRTRPTHSLGVVTLNIKQRDLIAELVDERLRTVPGADDFIQHWIDQGQRFFVRNLETVQGDERDAIVISTTFGRPPGASSPRQNFGPISRQGGWRRLNVLFTRAKQSIAIYTSMRPEDIIVDSSTPEGTRSLRAYLEYARTGQLAVVRETGSPPDSDFEVAVMEALRLRGYEVTPQLGVAGYRIDIAVKHPDAPGTYLAAIECDGASYHSAQSIRDRDRIRQDILESVGWRGRIWRIWSTDWFKSPRPEMEKLLGFLEHLRNTWKPEHSTGNSWVEEGVAAAERRPGTRDTPPAEEERRIVSEVLLDTSEEVEVEIGDVVRYADIRNPSDVLTVRIVRGASNVADGLITATAPLAQMLIGAIVGDEVALHVPGAAARTFKIREIVRPN